MIKRYTEIDDGIISSANSIIATANNAVKGKNMEVTTKNFIDWMKTNVGTSISNIKNWFISMSSSITSTTSRVAGSITAAFANIGAAVTSAIASTKAYIVALFQKTSAVLATPINGITYGKLIAIAVISSAVIFVMYKIYKAIKKRKSGIVSEVATAKGDLRRIKKSINESITFFDNMRYILREDASEENDVSGSASMRIIEKASGPAREMVNWIAKKNVNEGDEEGSSVGSFLRRHWGFIRTVCVAAGAIFVVLSKASHTVTLNASTNQIGNNIMV